MASPSAPVNGHGVHVNGDTSHVPPAPPAPVTSDLSGRTPSTSFSPVNGMNGYTPVPYHHEEIINYLYHSGFQTGNYADTILHVNQNQYSLHAIILSRSPFLAHLMSTSPQPGGQRTLYVHLEREPEVTAEGFEIALGYLYSSVSLGLIRPDNARAVLAAGCLLGGMDDLCLYAYEACRRSMSADTISGWLEFFTSTSPPESPTGADLPPMSMFDHYTERLRDDVFHFLVSLPGNLENAPTDAAGLVENDAARDVWLQIYSRAPFELFKAAIECPSFQIGSDQARFKFAKDAIELRRRGIARGTGEETVVLAFGGANAGSVHVARKMRKRPLWKVNC